MELQVYGRKEEEMTASAPSTFRFSALPAEIRVMIWELCLEPVVPEVVEVSSSCEADFPLTIRPLHAYLPAPISPIPRVCRESLSVVRRLWHYVASPATSPGLYFRGSRDVLCLTPQARNVFIYAIDLTGNSETRFSEQEIYETISLTTLVERLRTPHAAILTTVQHLSITLCQWRNFIYQEQLATLLEFEALQVVWLRLTDWGAHPELNVRRRASCLRCIERLRKDAEEALDPLIPIYSKMGRRFPDVRMVMDEGALRDEIREMYER